MSVEYTDPSKVTNVRCPGAPRYGQTGTGHGGQIPTAHMIEYLGVWRRVYAMAYGNSASLYVKVQGADVFLDPDTQHLLSTTD